MSWYVFYSPASFSGLSSDRRWRDWWTDAAAGKQSTAGNPGTKLRRTGQAQLSEFIHAAPRCEHSAFFSQELRHQVLDLAHA